MQAIQIIRRIIMVTASSWFYWALLSAVFAALTAIFFCQGGYSGCGFRLGHTDPNGDHHRRSVRVYSLHG